MKPRRPITEFTISHHVSFSSARLSPVHSLHQTHFLKTHLHITLPYISGSSKWLSTYYKNQKASSFRTPHLREFGCVFRRYDGFELWVRRSINFANNGLPQAPQGSVCGLVPKIRTSFISVPSYSLVTYDPNIRHCTSWANARVVQKYKVKTMVSMSTPWGHIWRRDVQL